MLQTRNTFQWQLAPVTASSRYDMQDPLFVRDLSHGEGERGIGVAEQEIDLVAFDQLARLHDRSPGVSARRILDDQLDRTAENAALGVDGVDRHLATD